MCAATSEPSDQSKKSAWSTIGAAAAWVVLTPFVLGMTLWAVGAIVYSAPPAGPMRWPIAAVFVLTAILALFGPRRRWVGLICFAGVWGVVLGVFLWLPAANNKPWQADVAREPTVEIVGERVTVKNVRNCAYRSEADFDVRWEERTYDLVGLRSVDLIMSYWGPRDICHTFVSFGFEGGDYLAASIETRKMTGQAYSALAGLFKQYTLVYVLADERDLIGLRTIHRKEEVYLYRLQIPPERRRAIFLEYARRANGLAAAPEFYNVLSNSCGMNIVYAAWGTGGTQPFRPWLLLNGRWDKHMHARGGIDHSMPFEETRRASKINERAQAAGTDAPDFSAKIREGLPGMAAQ